MEKKRGRPPVNKEVLNIITKAAIRRTNEKRYKLALDLAGKIKGANLTPPSLEYIMKLISKARTDNEARTTDSKALDKPWGGNNLIEYPIQPDALPLVFSIAGKCSDDAGRKYLKTGEWDDKYRLTIREALWIARLYRVIEFYLPQHKKMETNFKGLDDKPEGYENMTAEDLVLDWAYWYSVGEIINEINSNPNWSSMLDDWITKDVFAFYGDRKADIEGVLGANIDYEAIKQKLFETMYSIVTEASGGVIDSEKIDRVVSNLFKTALQQTDAIQNKGYSINYFRAAKKMLAHNSDVNQTDEREQEAQNERHN